MSLFSKILSLKRKWEAPFETLNKISISKEAILNNYDIFQKLNPGYAIFPVLKSNAYGHGIREVATILRERTPEYIAVDSYFEVLKIREVSNAPILLIGYVLNENLGRMDFKNLSLVVYDLDSIRELGRMGKKVKIHLKIDTGMNRQGVSIEQMDTILDEIKKHPNIFLEGVCTHLSDGDNSENDYSLRQMEKFKVCIDTIEKAGFALKYKHLSNSAGGAKFHTPDFNAMRLGIGLYGVNPLEKEDANYRKLAGLRLALSFESTLIIKKHIKKGEKVSYNGTFTAPKDMTIGVVPVGYYEGLSRKLSSNFNFSFRGKPLPILGRVCMNLTVLDIGDNEMNIGDKISIISNEISDCNNIYEMAKKSETITYECFTRLSESIRRVVV